MLGINTVSHIETAPCYVSSFRCQLCHLDVGESRDSDPSHKGWELSHVQQPSSRTCPSAQGLCWVLCREHPLVTPLWESWRKISDILIFYFYLFSKIGNPSYLVSWFVFGLDFVWVGFGVFFFCFLVFFLFFYFCFGLVFVYFSLSPLPFTFCDLDLLWAHVFRLVFHSQDLEDLNSD